MRLTPLHRAAQKGDLSEVTALLEQVTLLLAVQPCLILADCGGTAALLLYAYICLVAA